MSSRLQCLPVENKFLTSSNTRALVVNWSFNDYNYSFYLRLQQEFERQVKGIWDRFSFDYSIAYNRSLDYVTKCRQIKI